MPNNPNFINTKEAESTGSEWDELTKMADDFQSNLVRMAPERAKEFYASALDVERKFVERNADLVESMSRKEFEKWEDALSGEIQYAERELSKANPTIETEADSKVAIIYSFDEKDLTKTVEAQAGNFYRVRMRELQDAILGSKNEGALMDLRHIHDFPTAVMNHLDFKYMTPDEISDTHEYDRRRTASHNDVIRKLNNLNNLAKKYGVRPLTARNFWPSDVRDKNDQTPAVSEMMAYDRNVVVAYYTVAFSSEIARRDMIAKRQQEWFGY